MTGPFSKLPPPPPEDIPFPGRRELAIALLRTTAVGILTFYLVRWALRHADPTYQQKQKAKEKAKELMSKIGVQGVSLNEHEVMIASHLVDPSHLRMSWADVAGLDDVIDQIKKTVIYPILAHQKQVRVSRLVQPPKGILLYGPPGCGKTLIAKAMAKEAKCWFINLDVSVLTDKWYGESQKLTAAVFSLAEKLQPCIIFIDEIDSLLRLRATQDHEVTAMMKAQFMANWDGLITDPKKTVIVMGATNRPRDMDAAILRRMATKFYIPLPDKNQRKHILDLTLKNEVLDAEYDLNKLSDMTEGFSGADLKEIARSAAVACLSDLQLSRDSLNSISSVPIDGSRSGVHNQTSWFSSLNPFGRRASIPERDTDDTSSTSTQRSLSLRPISMRDFQFAINKAKEARSHCSNPLSRQRIELD